MGVFPTTWFVQLIYQRPKWQHFLPALLIRSFKSFFTFTIWRLSPEAQPHVTYIPFFTPFPQILKEESQCPIYTMLEKKKLGKEWGKRREPISKCFGAREAEDILNMCPKNQGVFSLLCRNHHYWIPCSCRHGTRMAPRKQEPSRVCSAHGCRAWRRAGTAPGVLPISVQQQIGEGSAHNSFSHMCGANSVTSPICFPISLFIIFIFFLISWAVLRYEIRRAEMILKETEPSLQGNLIPKLSLD